MLTSHTIFHSFQLFRNITQNMNSQLPNVVSQQAVIESISYSISISLSMSAIKNLIVIWRELYMAFRSDYVIVQS